ncbi:MAG: arsenate reductase ArsC [Deltaproteobacteria bacterium]|nr:arsenate reductase ArsC [Deltaproteobacteria bacterium]
MRVLFLCTGNSCRSQMAEAWTRHFWAGSIEAESAGTKPKGLDPLAVEAMQEAGVDISGQASKGMDAVNGRHFDLVITVCSVADENCPLFPGAPKIVHAGFDDPPRLAKGLMSGEEAMAHC